MAQPCGQGGVVISVERAAVDGGCLASRMNVFE